MSLLSPAQLLAELERFASNPPNDALTDAELRANLHTALDAARTALERPVELVVRMLLSLPVESAMFKAALDLELFPLLKSDDGKPRSSTSLSTATGAEPALLRRMLRVLSAIGAVLEHGNDTYILSPNYSLFADSAFNDAVRNCGNFLDPIFQALPEFLKDARYRNPKDANNTVIQRAFKQSNSSMFEIMSDKPAAAKGLGVLLNTWADGHAFLQDMYPVQDRLASSFDPSVDPTFFVDVGGATGQKSMTLRQSLSNVAGRFVVQDLPVYIEQAPEVNGIEFMVHNFFTEQPIKGAKAYYIRQCLHNHSDKACIQILRRLQEACKAGYSKVLVHEQIVPEVGASAELAVEDITMMALFAVGERTEQEWTNIIQNAGLKVLKIYPPKDRVSESVIEAGVEE